MKKIIVAVALGTVISAAFANPVNSASAPVAADTAKEQPATELAALVGIRSELISLHAAMLAPHDNPSTVCKYEDKTYSEGAIRQVGKVGLICVQREWGIHNMNDPVVLVWEPITSQRIETYRRATRLSAGPK